MYMISNCTHTHTHTHTHTEVMGAVVSVLIIWVITGVLLYEAVQRVINPIKIDADIMLITACAGVFVNTL